jgi:multiple sugar transport system substrate-binding protein
VDGLYRASTRGVETGPPTGLGSKTDAFTQIYQDTFSRIVLDNEDIGTVLNYETPLLQRIVDDAGAACWPPDAASTGPCQIK